LKQAFLIIVLLLSGCAMVEKFVDAPVIILPQKAEAAESRDALPEPKPYTVLYETTGLSLAMYEPAAGCYLGAIPDGGMKDFENRTGKKHAVYAAAWHLDGEYPGTWMLQCIAAQATPLIFIHSGKMGFSTWAVRQAAQKLGEYNIPLFVAFEPFNRENSAAAYTLHYRYARAVFMEYAPLAAFVWLTDADADSGAYYPGHDAVDWVGLRVMAEWEQDGFFPDIKGALETFYRRYHWDKPVMLAPAGICHFSERDYVYRIPEAADELRSLYEDIRYHFPRVKMVAYMDKQTNGGDFSVSNERALLDVYRQSVSDRYFLSAVERESRTRGWRRSDWEGYVIDGRVYIHEKTADLFLYAAAEKLTVNGMLYVDADRLTERFIITDHERGVIFIYTLEES
jgi:hypothetical protein